jgi:hypothetical protein
MAGDGAGLPPDPITGWAQGAAAVHEMYISYVAGGFTEQQALYLVGQYVRGLAQQTPGSD